MDYSFMRTGLAGEGGSRRLPDEFVQHLVSIVMTMVTKAAETAMTYCEHAGRKMVSQKDIHYGLRYQARTFLQREHLESEIQETKSALFVEDEESEEEESEDDEEEEEWMESNCECATCKDTNMYVREWDAWQPQDSVEQFVKHAIEQTIAGDEASS